MSNYQDLCINDTHSEKSVKNLANKLGQTAEVIYGQTLFNSPLKLIQTWGERSRQRHHLSLLTAQQQDDIGVTAKQVAVEVAKPFWVA